MWRIWTLTQATNKPASEVVKVQDFLIETIGREDRYAELCFDEAVYLFGKIVEGKLAETDKKGRAKHKLADLLRDEDDKPKRFNLGMAAIALSRVGGVDVSRGD